MKLKDLLCNEDKWTQGALARNADGEPVDPESEEAVCWCLIGGIHRCCVRPVDVFAMESKLNDFVNKNYGVCIVSFNETQTFEKIKSVLDWLGI